uniref:Uncharacterized protein n=1 Tax=Anopheles dirus TaxID=7168 RepID=A0A182NDP3_9DIPT
MHKAPAGSRVHRNMQPLVRQVITEDCGQEELVQCTRPLQVLSATSELSFVTKKEELDKLCP